MMDFDALAASEGGEGPAPEDPGPNAEPEACRRDEEAARSRSRIAEAAAQGGRWHLVLGVREEAALEEVRRAYRDLALLHHPDKHPEGGEDETFKHVQKAYEEALAAVRVPVKPGVVASAKTTPLKGSLVTTSFDGTIKIWAARTGQCRRTLRGHTDHVHSVALSPDGKRIATGAMDRTLRIWSLDSLECEEVIQQAASPLRMLQPSFSPDGQHILTVSLDDMARAWNLVSGQLAWTFRGHKGQVNSACFARKGELVATGSSDKSVRLFAVPSCKLVRTLEGHARDVLTVSAAPSGEFVVSGSQDHTLRVWRLPGGLCMQTLEGHDDFVISSAVHPSSEYIASGSDDCTARVWDVTTGECLWNWTGLGYVNSICFSPDGARAATGTYDRAARIWNLETGKCERLLKGHEGVVSAVLFVQ